jgi:hypothetical protein
MRHLGALLFCVFFLVACSSSISPNPEELLGNQGLQGKIIFDVTSNSTGVYVSGTNSNQTGFLRKYTTSGSLVWERTFGAASQFRNNIVARYVVVDSSGNVYTLGDVLKDDPRGANGFSRFPYVTKFNSSGVLQWQHVPSNDVDQQREYISYELEIDGSGNVYTVTQKYSTNGYPAIVVFRTSPQRVSQQLLVKEPSIYGPSYTQDLQIDKSNNLYLLYSKQFYQGPPTQGNDLNVVKYTSNGTFRWERNVYKRNWDGVTREQSGFIRLDNAGNIIVLANHMNKCDCADAQVAYLRKLNSEATFPQLWNAWVNSVKSGAPTFIQTYPPLIDIDNSVYTFTDKVLFDSGTYQNVLVKYNSTTGSRIYTRTIPGYDAIVGYTVSANSIWAVAGKYTAGFNSDQKQSLIRIDKTTGALTVVDQ